MLIICSTKGDKMKDNNYKPDPEISKEIKNIRKEVIEKGLNNSEDRFKLLFDFAPDGYYISDLKGNFIDGNKAAERITGYTRAELVGKNYFKTGLLPSKDIPRAVSALKQNRKGLPMEPQEFNLNRKEGTSIDVEISTYPIRINNKIYVLGIARDITKRKQLEKVLKQSEKEKEIVLAISPVHIVYHDLEHNIVWANKAACDSVGKSLKEIKGKKCYQVWAKRDTICRECPIDRAWKTAKMERGEMRTPDNRYWMVTGVPFVNEEGKIIGAVESTMDITDLKITYQNLEKTINATIETISRIMDTRDLYTAGHQVRVSKLAIAIAKEMKLPSNKIETIRIASLIHDIGKIGIPSEILTKPGKLTDIEISLIRSHSKTGYDIVKDIEFPYHIAPIILQHHERNDGSGYPNGLKSDEILLEAKIIAVADVVEAMSSHRPYRAALGVDTALDEIIKNKDILYDGKIVDICVNLFEGKRFKFEKNVFNYS